MGRDVRSAKLISTPSRFQSTRPRGARRQQQHLHLRPMKFQSTRPRGARLQGIIGAVGNHKVSIHAPTWGATPHLYLHHVKRMVSIHAPTWGATCSEELLAWFGLFQSTRPRGARRLRTCKPMTMMSFNPRAHVGRDFTGLRYIDVSRLFQSTRPRGARLNARIRVADAKKFQSTRPRGARHRRSLGIIEPGTFQSTRPRGARLLRPVPS